MTDLVIGSHHHSEWAELENLRLVELYHVST